MQFRIGTIFYVMALLGSALATFGSGGVFLAGFVVVFWWIVFISVSPRQMSQRLGAIVILVLLSFGCCAGVLWPSVSTPREAARRASCRNNLKQIALGLLLYRETNLKLPPARGVDENGKPMHSWRIRIIPYLESTKWYDQYRFDEPWDGPNNRKLHKVRISLFHCPSSTEPDTCTNYFAVTGPQTIWGDGVPPRLSDMSDGAANTILVIEAHGKGVHWMEPKDITFEEAVAILTETDGARALCVHGNNTFFYETSGARHIAMNDGHVILGINGWTQESAEALLTHDGGEGIGLGEIEVVPGGTRRLRWGRISNLTLFVLLSLLPFPFAYRQKRRAANP